MVIKNVYYASVQRVVEAFHIWPPSSRCIERDSIHVRSSKFRKILGTMYVHKSVVAVLHSSSLIFGREDLKNRIPFRSGPLGSHVTFIDLLDRRGAEV
jgi:hypothetical protein